MKHRLLYLLALILTCPLAYMPQGASVRLCQWAVLLWARLDGQRRRRILSNMMTVERAVALRLTGGSLQATQRALSLNLGRILAEVLRLVWGRGDAMVEAVRVEGAEHFWQAKAKGKGVILATGHFGNWELVPATLAVKVDHDMAGIANRLKNDYLNAAFERSRLRYKGNIVYKEGAVRALMKFLKAGKGVLLIMDEPFWRSTRSNVRFLGYSADLTEIAASMARRTGASIVPLTMLAEPEGGHVLSFHPALPLTGQETADTQLVADFFTGFVAEHPEHWLQWPRKWKWLK